MLAAPDRAAKPSRREPYRLRSWATFRRALAAGVLAAAAAGAPGPAAEAASLVSCGQIAGPDAVLRESCTGDVVMRGGRLDLDGHTLRGTVFCEADACEIVSDPPGAAIVGSGEPGSFGIVAGERGGEASGDVIVRGLTVRGFATGVAARSVVLANARVAHNLWRGVDAAHGIEAVDAVVAHNGDDGLHAGVGAAALDGCVVSRNGGSGVRALTGVVALGSRIESNGRDGIENYSNPALAVDSVVARNGRHGVRSDDSDCDPAAGIELRGTEVSLNAAGEACADGGCADLVSCAPPTLDAGAACGTTQRMGAAGSSWGVCAGD